MRGLTAEHIFSSDHFGIASAPFVYVAVDGIWVEGLVLRVTEFCHRERCDTMGVDVWLCVERRRRRRKYAILELLSGLSRANCDLHSQPKMEIHDEFVQLEKRWPSKCDVTKVQHYVIKSAFLPPAC